MKTYWGYKDKDKNLHVKKFSCFNEIHDLYSSGECVTATGPFPAKTSDEAKAIVKRKLRLR